MSSLASDDVVMIDRDDVSNYNPEQILPESPEEIRAIRSWLEPTEYWLDSGEYRKHLASHVNGTGAWLTSSETYSEWLKSKDHGLLWIKGIPGSGKSVVAAHLIDELTRANYGAPVLYFFFRQIIDANHGPAALLRDWLDQILQYSPPLQKRLKELREDRRTIDSMSMEDLWKLLHLAFAGIPDKVFCVADALDEMDQGNDYFLQALAELGQWRPARVKIVITSRPVPNVEAPLRHAKGFQMRLVEDKVDLDISSYVERGLASTAISADDQALIKKAIPGRANGLFLYAKLAMDAFLKPGARILDVIDSLPADLHELYTELLREHARRSGVPDDVQLLILQWVTHATRPLRLIELAEIVRSALRLEEQHDFKASKDLVRAAAGPLLEIMPDETVSVIHHSFTEYLKCETRSKGTEEFPVLRVGSTNNSLALACLKYLLQSGCLEGINQRKEPRKRNSFEFPISIRPGLGKAPNARKERSLNYPFLSYAAVNWYIHARRSAAAGFPQGDTNALISAMTETHQYMQAWLNFGWPDKDYHAKNFSPLHIAAKLGLNSYVEALILQNAMVDAVDADGRTPLWLAAASGHGSIVTTLIQAGASPDVADNVFGLKPLHKAAQGDHDNVVRVLLEAGVDPLTPKTRESPGRRCGNAPRSTGHTPLMYACEYGHLKAVEAFLPFLTQETAHRALIWSVKKGRTELVKNILQYSKVNINEIVRGETALFSACCAADLNIIKVLMQAGADPTVICHPEGSEFHRRRRWFSKKERNHKTKGDTALQAFCTSQGKGRYLAKDLSPEELQEIYSVLIRGGANIHQCTYSGNTVLHSAVDNPVLVRLLLRDGADANAVNDSGLSPLHETTSIESMALLIEEGDANIDLVHKESGETPLLRLFSDRNSWRHDRSEAIMKLLEYKPNVNVKNKDGDGPLHLALKSGVENLPVLIQALLDSNVDVHGRNYAGDTPLLVLPLRLQSFGAAKNLIFDAANLILDAGANINERNSQGTTLIWRVMNSDLWNDDGRAIATFLKDKGADFEVRDRAGRTLLHLATASRSSNTERLQFLIDQGLNVRELDYGGNTLFHELAKSSSNEDYINLGKNILALGLRLDQPNYEGKTALHIPTVHRAYRSWMLSNMQTVDQRDYEGNTALHVAVANSDVATKQLLETGADPSLPNHEGRVPLHIAAISRQCNILGILLENIDRPHSKIPEKNVIDFQDNDGNTPLYYAVRSGRLESVKMLVNAGADITSPRLFVACASFEHELPPTKAVDSMQLSDDRDTLRLDEIVNILMENGESAYKILKNGFGKRFCIEYSAKWGHDYTYSVFLRARDQLSLKFEVSGEVNKPANKGCDEEDTDDEMERFFLSFNRPSTTEAERAFLEHEAAHKQQAQAHAIEEYTGYVTGEPHSELVHHLLKTRQYGAFPALFAKGVDMIASDRGYSALELFAQNGFSDLLDQIATLEVSRRDLSDNNGHGLFEGLSAEEGGKNCNSRFILFRATDREIPNMEVVRLLVEKYRVNIDQVDSDGSTVLHHLSEGKYWWHVALAIPYLLSKGANSSLRNLKWGMSQTPLRVALGKYPDGGRFSRDALHALLEGHGVSVDVDTFRYSLELKDPGIIRTLLAAGADPNDQSSETVHPLHTIAKAHMANSSHKKQLVESFEILLEFGADPFSVHSGYINSDQGAVPLLLSKPRSNSEQVTVLHQLLARGLLVHPILTRNDFDPSYRDQEGRTPLHAACRSPHGIHAPIDIAHQGPASTSPSFLDHMLLRGADPLAVDNNGRNILHYMFIGLNESTFTNPDASSLAQIARNYPSLLNQVDDYGKTPFLLAVRNTALQHDSTAALALLNAGADPRAVDSDLNTALHILAFALCTPSEDSNTAMRSLFMILIENGLDINARNSLGQTPVFHARNQTHQYTRRHYDHDYWTITSDMIPFFESAGADLFVTDKCGRGLLHHQARRDDTEVFEALLNRGLDPALEDVDKKTPLDVAAAYDSKYILKLFSKKNKAEAELSV